jgi:hypothetical protein
MVICCGAAVGVRFSRDGNGVACAGLMRCMVRYIEVFASTEADLEASKRTGDSNVQRMNDDDPHYQVCCFLRDGSCVLCVCAHLDAPANMLARSYMFQSTHGLPARVTALRP